MNKNTIKNATNATKTSWKNGNKKGVALLK